MRRFIKALILAVMASMIFAAPVLALAYSATFQVVNTSATAYAMVGVNVTSNVSWLADNGFIEADGLDTRVETLAGTDKPHMLAEDRIMAATPVPAISQTNLYLTTGNSDLTTFPVVVGYGGYITTEDDASLELSDNFTCTFDGYFDASVSANLMSKPDAIRIYGDGSGNITASIGADTDFEQLDQDTDENVYIGDTIRTGEKFLSFPASKITQISFKLKKVGVPTGTAYITARTVTGDTLLGIIGTLDVSTLTTDYAWYDFTTTPINNTSIQNIYVLFEFNGGGYAAYVDFGYENVSDEPNANMVYYAGGGYYDKANSDATIKVYTDYPYTVTAAGVTSGDKITVSANTTHLRMLINDVLIDDDYLDGTGIPDNSENWTFINNNIMPYADEISITVGGNPVLTYAPITILEVIDSSTANLTDTSGSGNYGVITWGSNPTDVSVLLGSMMPVTQPSLGDAEDDIPSSVLDEAAVSDWYGDGTVAGSILTNPLRPFVTMISDNTTLSELLAWRFLGMALLLFVTVAVGAALKGHLGITVIVSSVVLGGLVALDHNIFPLYLLVIAVVMFIGGLIAERSQSL